MDRSPVNTCYHSYQQQLLPQLLLQSMSLNKVNTEALRIIPGVPDIKTYLTHMQNVTDLQTLSYRMDVKTIIQKTTTACQCIL